MHRLKWDFLPFPKRKSNCSCVKITHQWFHRRQALCARQWCITVICFSSSAWHLTASPHMNSHCIFAAIEATSDSNFPSHINEFHNRWISFDTVRRMNSIFHHTHSPYMHSNRLPHQQSARYEVHGLVKLGCECHKCLLSSSLRKA